MGYNIVDKKTVQEREVQEGGIWNPKPVKLRRGQALFRVGHSKSKRGPIPMDVNLSSPWWMEGDTFADISISANTLGISAQAVARLKLSVSQRYGVFDTIFCVRLREPLGALKGEGNPVYDPPEPGSQTPPPVWAFPGRAVMQCYIPGLRYLDNEPSDLADRAFDVLGTRPVHAWISLTSNGLS